MEPIEKRTRLIVAATVAFALVFSILFSYLPGNLGFSQTAAALGYEDYFDSSSLMRVDVTVDADAWQAMLDSAASEQYIECDIALNGESVSSAGIRCKGNSSLSMTQDERYSFKINFGEYVKKQTFHGLDKMALNNTQSDNTFIKEYLSYYLLRKAGAKTPLFAMAEIYVNGEYWGLYLAVECIDDAFIERNFSTDGGFLYKPDGTGGMGGGMGDDQDNGFADFTPPDMSDFGSMTPPDGFDTGENTQSGTDSSNAMTPPDNMQSNGTGSDGMTPPDKPDSDSTGSDNAQGSGTDSNGMTPPDKPDGTASDGTTPPDMPGGDFSDFTLPDGNGGGFDGGFGGSAQSAAALGYLGDDVSLYGDIFDYSKTNDPSDADKARLIAALKALSEGELDSALDVDDAVSWLAANALLVNDDGYLGNMLHNYYLYEQNGKLTILPWDYNLAFGGFAGGSATSAVNDPIDTPASSDRPLVTALLSDEDCLEQYHSILYDLATFLTDGSMDTLITELTDMIDESVQNDPTKECTYEDYLTAIETLRSFCTLRGESILGQLDGSIPSTTAGQSEDSSALIQADFALSDMGAQGGGKGGFGNFGGFDGFDQAAFGGNRPNFPNGQNSDMPSPPDKTNGDADASSDSTNAQTADGQTPPDKPGDDGATSNATGDTATTQPTDSANTDSANRPTPPDKPNDDGTASNATANQPTDSANTDSANRPTPPDKPNDDGTASNATTNQPTDGANTDSTNRPTPPDKPGDDGTASNATGDTPTGQPTDSANSDATAAPTSPDETGGNANSTDSDAQQTADSRQNRRAPNGMNFGVQGESTATGTSIAYAAVLDGAAVIALIAALILIMRRRR